MIKKDFHIWEGIFDRFPEENTDRVWESDHWVNALGERSLASLRELDKNETISTHNLMHDYPLPLVVALLAGGLAKPVRVLDFGGGVGSSFLPLITSLPSPELVEFHIVDSIAICRRGRDVYQEFPNIYFHESLPQHIKKFDLIHAAASLHYVSDWRTMMVKFTDY
jgi:putative methyltransferase (TIGR04325 family)